MFTGSWSRFGGATAAATRRAPGRRRVETRPEARVTVTVTVTVAASRYRDNIFPTVASCILFQQKGTKTFSHFSQMRLWLKLLLAAAAGAVGCSSPLSPASSSTMSLVYVPSRAPSLSAPRRALCALKPSYPTRLGLRLASWGLRCQNEPVEIRNPDTGAPTFWVVPDGYAGAMMAPEGTVDLVVSTKEGWGMRVSLCTAGARLVLA